MSTQGFPFYATLQEIQEWCGCVSIDELLENGRINVSALKKRDPNVMSEFPSPRFEVIDGQIVNYYERDKSYFEKNVSNESINVPFALLYTLVNTEYAVMKEHKIYKSSIIPVHAGYNSAKFDTRQYFGILLEGKIGLYKNLLVNAGLSNYNIYATPTNIVELISADCFPFGARLLYPALELQVGPELNQYFKFTVDEGGIVEDYRRAVLKMQDDSNVWLHGLYHNKAIERTDVEVACASYLCVFLDAPENLDACSRYCEEAFHFSPLVYFNGNRTCLPDLVPSEKSYIPFDEFCRNFSNEAEIETHTSKEGLKVLSWNLQNQSTLGYLNSLQQEFPFSSWKCYKYPVIEEVFEQCSPDVFFVTESGPIIEIYKKSEELEEEYHLIAEGINIDSKLPPGDNYFSSLLIKRKFPVIHSENFAFTKLSLDIPLCRELHMKEPINFEKILPFTSFNTASFAVIECESQRIAIAAVYPNWQYTTEVVKYFQIKYALTRLEQLKAEYSCRNVLLCGDLNITPGSPIYYSFYKKVTAEEADAWVTNKVLEKSIDRSMSDRLYFEAYLDVLDSTRLESVFCEQQDAGHIEDAEELTYNEPLTTTTEDFCDCLDYQWTDMEVVEKAEVYNAAEKANLPNAQCVTDHAPLLSVLRCK